MNRTHYAFAHHVVKDYALSRAPEFFTLMASEDRSRFTAWLWEQASSTVGEAPSDAYFSGTGVAVGRMGKWSAVLLALPPPGSVAEAFFALAVDVSHGVAPDAPTSRYFTLELGRHADDRPRTVLCEWTKEAHHSYGDGPPPEKNAFMQAVESRLAQP